MRPVDLVAPGSVRVDTSSAATVAMPAVAPYVAAVSDIDGPACELALHLGGLRLAAVWRGGEVSLSVDDRPVRSRRFAGGQSPSRLGISLTGTHLTAWADESGSWVARARYDLVDDLDPRDESVLAGLAVEAPRNGHARRRLRAARTPRRAGRVRRGRYAGPRGRRPLADRDLRRTGLLRHRAHQRVAPRPDDVRARPLRRPVLPQARPTRGLRRPRDPPRPARRRVAGGDQHVGRLRAARDARWSAYGIGVAGHPRRVRGRPAARHPRPGHPRAAAPDGRVRLDRDLGSPPGAA